MEYPTAAVIGLNKGDWTTEGRKEGSHYDNCINPACGKRDVERKWKIGGTHAGNGENYLHAAIYGCPKGPGQDGCGASWARTTEQGVAADAAKGVKSKWGTQSAERGRTISVPSDAYRAAYDAIDWDR